MSQSRLPPEMPSVMASTASLSPEARALLSEITSASAPSFASLGDAPSPAIILAPHPDARADAFADLLNHVGDGELAVSGSTFDEASALAAVDKYNAEKNAAPTASDAAFDVSGASDTSGASDASEARDDIGLEESEDLLDEDVLAAMDDDPFFDLEDEPATGLRGVFARLTRLTRKGGANAKRLVGVKDANAAYRSQSGRSLLPFTIMRTLVLVLVAAVPPLVNLTVIQPQISDNNRKLTQIRTFEAKSQEDQKIADAVAGSLVRVQKMAELKVSQLMPETAFQDLFTGYLAALQKYDVEILSYNVASDKQRKVVVGTQVQEASLVAMELVGRYDVYTEIRRVFVEQSQNIQVLNEAFEVVPGSLDLKIKARFLVPTLRDYDAELDTVVDAKKENG
jgi:hypothetical protein